MDNSTFMEDPFLPGNGLMVLPAVSALSGRYSSHQAGWIYMSISDRLILDYLKSFPLNPDSFLCLTIGGRTWLYENDRLKSCDWKFEPVKDLSEMPLTVIPPFRSAVFRMDPNAYCSPAPLEIMAGASLCFYPRAL